MKLLLIFAAGCALALGQNQIPVGRTVHIDNVDAVVTYFGCAAIPGVPLGPSQDCQPGMMVSVQTTEPSTLAFVVTINYTDEEAKPQTATATVSKPTTNASWATVMFLTGWHPISSISVVELKAGRTSVLTK